VCISPALGTDLREELTVDPNYRNHLDLEKPLLREVFRDLDVTRRYTLKPISDGQYIRIHFHALETRASKLKKSEKRKNRG
jgi:hypothetical protein